MHAHTGTEAGGERQVSWRKRKRKHGVLSVFRCWCLSSLPSWLTCLLCLDGGPALSSALPLLLALLGLSGWSSAPRCHLDLLSAISAPRVPSHPSAEPASPPTQASAFAPGSSVCLCLYFRFFSARPPALFLFFSMHLPSPQP